MDDQVVISFLSDQEDYELPAMGLLKDSDSLTVHPYVHLYSALESESPPMHKSIARVRTEFLIWSRHHLLTSLGLTFLGLVSVYVMSFRESRFSILQKIAHAIFISFAVLRVYQWSALRSEWSHTVVDLGGWAAYMRSLAFRCPDTVKNHQRIRKFLLINELKFLNKKISLCERIKNYFPSKNRQEGVKKKSQAMHPKHTEARQQSY